MRIEYPKFLEDLLQQDRTLRAAVDSTIADFDIWLNISRLPFFTDYTDHGIDHLNQVIATATSLITDDAKIHFTPADAAVLILSTLLHDSALHLSEAGFKELIQGSASEWQIRDFDTTNWSDLWNDFLFSAKRWDDRKLKEIFGDFEDESGVPIVRDPFLNYDNLTDRDRKLIGEFIRWHHPRIAHEFAIYGVPASSSDPILPTASLGQDIRDIVGLVARSHGLPLRSCVEYLNEHYHRREYQNIHAVYIMVLLRVADYLQIQADRAPNLVFRYRHIPSKISQLEWRAHNAITNITQTHDDPESIEIQAQPEDVKTFLRLKDWLSGIQEELDKSWAVLGEIYGSHKNLSNLGLILRRVRSNLDNVEKFAKTVEYVPERIELSVARPDLLKLLVGPLYDNIPSIGVRELMQNAIDAVRERWALEEKHPELRKKIDELMPQESDVEIWIDDPDKKGYRWLTISDKGVGMTVEIIRDYFLTAGASFRNSDAWKKEYESEDEEKKSRVLRSGRFGVGILAGFLLGERMEISTRHIRSNQGVRFSTTIELEALELRYDNNLPIGTTIRIPISPEKGKLHTT